MAAKAPTEVRVQAGAAGPASPGVRLARRVLRGVFRLVFRVRVRGLDRVPPTPVIVCANHLGWTDAFLLLLFLPAEPRIYVLGERAGVLVNNFRTRVIDSLQVMIALERGQPREAIRAMEDVLRRGGSLLSFPEGNVGATEGTIQPLQPGAAHLSLRLGVPILPVGLTGTYDLWLRRPLTLRIGAPLDPSRFTEGSMHARIAAMTAALDGSLRALLPGDRARARLKPLRAWLTKLF